MCFDKYVGRLVVLFRPFKPLALQYWVHLSGAHPWRQILLDMFASSVKTLCFVSATVTDLNLFLAFVRVMPELVYASDNNLLTRKRPYAVGKMSSRKR